MELLDFILKYNLIVGLVGGVIGYFVKDMRDRRKNLLNDAQKEKREAYRQFISVVMEMQRLVGKGTFTPELFDNLQKQQWEATGRILLYAAPGVAILLGDFMQHNFALSRKMASSQPLTPEDDYQYFVNFARICAAMREELGLSNSDLGANSELLTRFIDPNFDARRA